MSSEVENNRVSISNSNVTQQNNDMTEILLATAMLKVRAADGTYKIMRTLIDQGSQVSIISENAAQRLALPRRNCKGSIYGVGVKPNSCKGVLHLTCSSMDDNYVFDTSVFIIQNLIKQLPNSTFAKPSWSFLNNIQLADPDFNISRPVDLLLGADIYSNIILPGICREEDQSVPIAQQTRLGWILCGNTKTYQCNVILNNIEQIEKFWETEDITEHFDLSEEDLQCIQYYEETTKRLSDGRYEVRLPLKPGYEKQLGSSKNKAIAHFLSMERKFRKNNSFEQNYKAFIHEYLALGHMKPAENITFHDIHHYVAIYILVGVAVIAAICLACKRLRQRRNTAITSSISLDNITTEGLSSAPVAALAAPRAQRAAAVPASRTQPVAASTERASSPAVPNAFNTQDRATSPILRTLILKRDEE
ncbi:unnamed protein product [Parnassius mnemosyne]|uniref:Peptidase A2 domain-containing protein n=1 Tax=Parnassius mnemosyne TaxID=213953 RepID=A0AAV1M4C6_9NEOP